MKNKTIEIIYPCEKCILCGLDLNSYDSYICLNDGHHSGTPLSLSNNCPLNKKPQIKEIQK